MLRNDAAANVVTDPVGSPNLLARKWNGAVSGTRSVTYQPDGSYWFQNNPGYIQAWLDGTTGTDGNLRLQRWNGSAWVTVATRATTSADETLARRLDHHCGRLQVVARMVCRNRAADAPCSGRP